MKNLKWEALLLCVGLFLLGYQVKSGITDFKDKERVVSVKGLAEMEVAADKVIWPLMYKEIGDDLISLYNIMNRKNQAIVSFLKANGVTAQEISIAPPEVLERLAAGEQVDPDEYYFRTHIRLSTDSERLDRLNRVLGVARGERAPGGVAIHVHEVL